MTLFQVEYECRGLWTLGWHHQEQYGGMLCFILLFYFVWRRGHNLQFTGFCWNAVYPWDSWNVVWTQALHPPPLNRPSGERIMIEFSFFRWTITLSLCHDFSTCLHNLCLHGCQLKCLCLSCDMWCELCWKPSIFLAGVQSLLMKRNFPDITRI